MYQILPYTFAKARTLNVIVKPSTRKGKKIDVFDKRGNYITSVGAKGYMDYPSYRRFYGRKYADQRRKLYKIRHSQDRMVTSSAGWYADKLLW